MERFGLSTSHEAVLESPQAWDQAIANPQAHQSLLSWLLGLEPSPLRNARLAQLYLLMGQVEAAAKALQISQPHPLLAAARLSLLSVRCQYPQILHLAAALSAGPDPLSREAMARTHYQIADAHLYLHRYAEGARWAEQAAREARAVGMLHFAQVCDLLREECVASREENLPPEEREQTLRALITDPPSEQVRIEACMRLIRLMYRQGKYQKSLRLALEVPRELHGQGFVELGMILNRLDDELDWDKVASSGQLGRLRAIKGLIELEPDFILEGPPPPPQAPLHPRPMAEWQVAFGWACLVKGRYPEALRYFQSSFIHRSEWDLRLVRDVSLIALHLEAPALVEEHFNPLALIEEAAWLMRERIWPESLVLRQIPRAAPYATALLLAIPGGCASLEPVATQSLAFAGPAGLTVNGVTHTNVQSILRLIEGNTLGMNSGAVRSARLRLKLLLQEHGEPVLVRTSRVREHLARIAGLAQGLALTTATGKARAQWEESVRDYARRYGWEAAERQTPSD